jgi:hypothetical protein
VALTDFDGAADFYQCCYLIHKAWAELDLTEDDPMVKQLGSEPK